MLALVPALALAFAATPPVLTLSDALSQARAKNLDVKAAEAKLAEVRELTWKVSAAYLPQVSVGGGYQYNNVEASLSLPIAYYIEDVCPAAVRAASPSSCPKLDKNPPQQPVPMTGTSYVTGNPAAFSPAIPLFVHNQWAGQATLTQTLLAPALVAAMKSASYGVDAAALGVDAARREVLFAVAQLYYAAVTAREAISVQQKLEDANAAHEKDAKARVDAGALPRMALLRARIDRVKSEQDVTRARLGYASVKSTLSALLDRPEDFDVAAPPEAAPLSLDGKDAAEVVRERPDVRAASLSTEAADWGALAPKLSYLPNVGFAAHYDYANVEGFAGSNFTWNVGVGLSWTLFDGGLREANLREAHARLDEARSAERSTQLKAEDELRRAKLDLDGALANRTKATEQLELARENARLVQVNFNAGVATYIEVSDAASALAGAELGSLSETLNAQLAALKLEKAAGAFDPK